MMQPILLRISLNIISRQGLYSLNDKTSYHENLEAAKLDVIMILLFWNWLRCCRYTYHISERLEKFNPKSRGFETSRDIVVRRPSARWIEALVLPEIHIHKKKLCIIQGIQPAHALISCTWSTSGFPSPSASKAENVCMCWPHHVFSAFSQPCWHVINRLVVAFCDNIVPVVSTLFLSLYTWFA